jgi:predicted phage tail protein
MSDNSRKTPPFGSKKSLTRFPSHSDDRRDTEGFAARREREASVKDAVKEFVAEEITGRYEGEELAERRALRPPDERFSILEQKHDELKYETEKRHDELKRDFEKRHDDLKRDTEKRHDELRDDVKGLSDKMDSSQAKLLDGQKEMLGEMLSIVKKNAEGAHLKFTAEVDVDRAEKLAEVEVKKETRLDTVDAKKTRRATIAKIVAWALGGGGVVELIHWLSQKL